MSVKTKISTGFERILLTAILICSMLTAMPASAKKLNDKVLNRPYADMRFFHLGFSVGLNTFGMSLHHNGFVTEDGQAWQVSQPAYNPGFCVNVLGELRINNYFSFRMSPGLWFGNRVFTFYDANNGTTETQDMKSAYLVLPLELKYAAQRMRNMRPYIVGGIIPSIDVAKKSSDFIKTKPGEYMISIGFGCDFYLPYFKLIPELKFCFGLSDCIAHDRPDLVDDPTKTNVNASLKKATTQMVVLSFYFE
jgi:hypothetical protein